MKSVFNCLDDRAVFGSPENFCNFSKVSIEDDFFYSFLGTTRGQLISKCLFGVFTFFQKTNENKLTSSKVEFVRLFFGRNVSLKKSFRICLTFS